MVRHLASRAATAAIASLLFVHSTTAAGWQHIPGWGGFFGASQSSNANLVSCDLDGNGRPDLAALGSTWNVVDTGGESAGTVGVLEADAVNNWGIRGALLLPFDPLAPLVCFEVAGDNDHLLIAENFTSRVHEAAGSPLTLSRQISLHLAGGEPFYGEHAIQAVKDIDGDGDLEIIGTRAWQGPYVADYASGEVTWEGSSLGIYASGVRVQQLDGDPALELILEASSPGLILDGATLAVQKSFMDGFNGPTFVGNFDANAGTTELLTYNGFGEIASFVYPAMTPISTFFSDVGDPIIAADLDTDGRLELVTSTFGMENIVVRNAMTGAEIEHFNHPGFVQSKSLVADNLDQDVGLEIAYWAGSSSNSDQQIGIIDHDGQEVFTLARAFGPFLSTATGDLQGSGSQEVVFSSGHDTAGPRLHFVDANTGQITREPQGIGDSESAPALVATAQADGDAALEIVVAYQKDYSAKLVALDGVTLTPQWSRDAAVTPAFQDRQIVRMQLLDVEGDTTPEIVVLTDLPEVLVFGLGSGQILWSTAIAETDFFEPFSLKAHETDGDPAPEILVAAGRVLVAIDSTTHAEEWRTTFAAPILASTSWGLGSGCRIGAFLSYGSTYESVEMKVVHCNDGSVERSQRLKPGTLWVAATSDQGEHFLVASRGHLYEISATGFSIPHGDYLGAGLGGRGQAELQVLNGGLDFDIRIGSALSVNRLQFPRLSIFGGGFE